MDELVSRDEILGLERAKEKGKREEQNLERVRTQATENGRKQGTNEERAREKKTSGWGTGIKIAISLVVIALIVAAAALLTMSVNVTNVVPGNPLPYTTNYGVSFPEGQTIAIGSTQISVLSYQNELFSNIDGDQQKLVVGENRVISERRAVITTLGGITLMDTYFKINLQYNGDRDNRAYFDMAVQTSKQVPNYLLTRLLPAEMDARPI
jgi:hypothetical protein